MTKDDAAKKARENWSGGSSEFWLVNALGNLGLLKFEEVPPTLWELLRKHGLDVATAQHICNEAMLKGVRVPRDGPDDAVGIAGDTP